MFNCICGNCGKTAFLNEPYHRTSDARLDLVYERAFFVNEEALKSALEDADSDKITEALVEGHKLGRMVKDYSGCMTDFLYADPTEDIDRIAVTKRFPNLVWLDEV